MSQGSLWPESVVEYEMSMRGGGEGKREAGKVLKLSLFFLCRLRVCVFL